MCDLKNMLKQLILIVTIFINSASFGQNLVDTIYSSDTMVIRTFKKNGKLNWEESYFQNELIIVKFWDYNKNVFGCSYSYIKETKPRIDYRKEFYLDGSVKTEWTASKGKIIGKLKSYYRNGQTQCDYNYVDGKLSGTQYEYHENGAISFVGYYTNGKLEGKATFYFNNNQIWTERVYRNGKPWTVLTNFNQYGEPREKGSLLKGNGTLYIYDENGKLLYIEIYKFGKRIRRKKIKST